MTHQKVFHVHSGFFVSDPCRIVWFEPEHRDPVTGYSLSSILLALPTAYERWDEAQARADELNRLGVTPQEVMRCFDEVRLSHNNKGPINVDEVWTRLRECYPKPYTDES